MAKRKTGVNRTAAAKSPLQTSRTATADATEQRVVAFFEQVGRIAGTVYGKAEGWMDREALSKQIASVRDSASELVDQLKTTVAKVAPIAKPGGNGSASTPRARSGGVVDAPGKKHRKPMPRDPRAIAADAKASNVRSSKMMAKTVKQRGRG
jgi:hypothetical protein